MYHSKNRLNSALGALQTQKESGSGSFYGVSFRYIWAVKLRALFPGFARMVRQMLVWR